MSRIKRMACIGKDCVACGNCVKNCPAAAITMLKGLIAVVDRNKCIGCGKCGKACPAGVIELVEQEAEGV